MASAVANRTAVQIQSRLVLAAPADPSLTRPVHTGLVHMGTASVHSPDHNPDTQQSKPKQNMLT